MTSYDADFRALDAKVTAAIHANVIRTRRLQSVRSEAQEPSSESRAFSFRRGERSSRCHTAPDRVQDGEFCRGLNRIRLSCIRLNLATMIESSGSRKNFRFVTFDSGFQGYGYSE